MSIEQKLNEISTELRLIAAELRGRNGLHDRLSALEAKQELLVSQYWKGIGAISGISAVSAFAGAAIKYLLDR